MTVGLDALVRRRNGAFALDAAVVAEPGEVVAVLGPNGAGKTSLLRCLAGLDELDGGHIRMDGVIWDEPEAERYLPPDARSVGFVLQRPPLFEHLDVIGNVAFGLRARGLRRRAARRQASDWLDRLDLAALVGRPVSTLSGGESQRVALVQSLVTEPALLLLDEPLAAVDAAGSAALRRDLREILSTATGVQLLVTHDPVDAFALADRVVVLEHGAVTQAGRLADVAARPRSRHVADLVGVNLYQGPARNQRVRIAADLDLVIADGLADGPAYVVVPPRAVGLYPERPAGSPRNCWPATISAVELVGERLRVSAAGPVDVVAEVTRGAVAELTLAVGDPIWVSVKATEVTAYPA